MKRIEDIEEFEDIDTYHEISEIVEEVFQDRVEAHKHLVTANKEIRILNNRINAIENQLQQKENIIKEVRNWVNSTIDVIKQQPTGKDEWILERLNGFLGILDKENMK